MVKITDEYLWYQSDTAPGSSGAPAFNDLFQVVALHHSGAAKRDEESGEYILKDGRKVDSLAGIDESQVVWVANEGVRISVLCDHLIANLHHDNPFVADLFDAMKGGDIISNALSGLVTVQPVFAGAVAASVDPSPQPDAVLVTPVSPTLTVPLRLRISVFLENSEGTQVLQSIPPVQVSPTPAVQEEVEESALEALSRIKVDRDYTNRAGYNPQFLGVFAPVPLVTDLSIVSRLADGNYVLPYEHFSVVLNKQRRLPLFTMSNLDYSKKKRHPEPGKYGRKDLTGTSTEVWITDPRIPQQDQLPDRFYKMDGGYFDKGHVVRREDVCWGDRYDEVVRGNCDTFHVTNCTPQVAGFNRSTAGVDDWGDLENEIQRQAQAERLNTIAGPILSADDKFFNGKDDFGPVRLQIPKEFWKVVLANEGGRLRAYAFILQQDLTTVPEEFAVSATWKPYQVSIKELEERIVGFCFPPEIHAADSFGGGSQASGASQDVRAK